MKKTILFVATVVTAVEGTYLRLPASKSTRVVLKPYQRDVLLAVSRKLGIRVTHGDMRERIKALIDATFVPGRASVTDCVMYPSEDPDAAEAGEYAGPGERQPTPPNCHIERMRVMNIVGTSNPVSPILPVSVETGEKALWACPKQRTDMTEELLRLSTPSNPFASDVTVTYGGEAEMACWSIPIVTGKNASKNRNLKIVPGDMLIQVTKGGRKILHIEAEGKRGENMKVEVVTDPLAVKTGYPDVKAVYAALGACSPSGTFEDLGACLRGHEGMQGFRVHVPSGKDKSDGPGKLFYTIVRGGGIGACMFWEALCQGNYIVPLSNVPSLPVNHNFQLAAEAAHYLLEERMGMQMPSPKKASG
eukprot:Cvel_32159.t1-p1 / transcript=Cvel_32159.t1 / gene=Cvel_32159 / organism=Chromera_velia_CCMP2878 / gene_product=hypothetical protein / transcript_product=hypothetical protein / location=Cvel_scaffold4938:3182-5561(-) / protein_length=361 / sequence_SO=supercontig / SO=protein_coding / is_pseudo=false